MYLCAGIRFDLLSVDKEGVSMRKREQWGA
jgi:hypothetical protein